MKTLHLASTLALSLVTVVAGNGIAWASAPAAAPAASGAVLTVTFEQIEMPEGQILLSLYEQEYADFAKSPGRAEKLLAEGEWKADATLPADEVATCTILASTLMNFDEFTMKR